DGTTVIPVLACMGGTLDDDWWCALQALMWPEPGPGGETGANMLLDDRGDATLLVHKGVEFWAARAGARPDTAGSEEEKVILDLLRESLAADPQRFTKMASGIK